MADIRIIATTTEGDNVIVTGTVDGLLVKGQGSIASFNSLSSDGRKLHYLERVLCEACTSDNTEIHKNLRAALHMRVWKWWRRRSEHVLISVGVFLIGQIARHYFLTYLPLLEQHFHVNLSILK